MARLAAVQGLYQIALTQCKPSQVIAYFKDNPSAFVQDNQGDEAVVDVDQELFSAIVCGTTEHQVAVDAMIAGAVDERLKAERVEALLKAILRAGAFELHHHGKVSAGVIINDYVDVSHTFFDQKEPGFVNAVLDKLAKNLRPIS
jgi:N utilization substance protein B